MVMGEELTARLIREHEEYEADIADLRERYGITRARARLLIRRREAQGSLESF